MKIVILFFFLSSLTSCQSLKAQSCAHNGVDFEGQYSWKKRDKITKKVKTILRQKKLHSSWDNNSNQYEKIFIKSSESLSGIEVLLPKKKKIYELVKVDDFYLIKDFNFKKHVLGKAKPFDMIFRVNKEGRLFCEKKVVIKRVD